MRNHSGWRRVATVADTVSAAAICHVLASEGVPAEVRSDSSLLGEARLCAVMVPVIWLQRAQEILQERELCEVELERLATAGLRPPGSDGLA